MFHLIKMDPNGYTKDDEVSTDNPIVDSILTQRKLPRRIVENWGCHNSMGLGVEDTRDPWYFNRPVFNQLWKNAYLGVGEDGAKSIEKYSIPKQHLFYLSQLLHDTLLQGNYVQAAYAMVAISQSPQSLPEQIWRCGMEILKQCPAKMMGTKLKFSKLMSALCPQYSNQIVIDMAFQILRNGNDAREAYQFLVSNINNKRVKYDVMFRAYLGLFEYVLWKMDIRKKTITDEEYVGKISEKISFGDMNFNAKRALDGMRVVIYENGEWDCFVIKMLEILDYYNKAEEAISLLKEYREKNMENPNAHRYLYLYMKRTNQDEEKGFEVLKDLIELDITNKLFYDFIELLKDRGNECDVIQLLFKRLDHCCCKDRVEDWRMLFMLFKKYRKHLSTDEWKQFNDCINERRAWWPKYHFTPNSSNKFREFKTGQEIEKEAELSTYRRRIEKYFKLKDSKSKSGHFTSTELGGDADSDISERHCFAGSKRRRSECAENSDKLVKKTKNL